MPKLKSLCMSAAEPAEPSGELCNESGLLKAVSFE